MKFIIKWDIGYGCNYQTVEAENKDDADMMAYEAWKEDAESHADYSSEEYTEERANDYGLE